MSAGYLHFVFDGKIGASTILVTDGAKATPVFSVDLSITHKALKSDSESCTPILIWRLSALRHPFLVVVTIDSDGMHREDTSEQVAESPIGAVLKEKQEEQVEAVRYPHSGQQDSGSRMDGTYLLLEC